LPPVPHGDEVLLACLTPRALPRGALALDHPPDRRLGVAHAPLGLGHLHDARNGPQIGGEPAAERSFAKDLWKRRLVFSRHQRRSPGPRDRTESFRPSLFRCGLPLEHGHRSHTQAPGHLGLGEPRAQQSEAVQSTFFESRGVTTALGPSPPATGERLSRISTTACTWWTPSVWGWRSGRWVHGATGPDAGDARSASTTSARSERMVTPPRRSRRRSVPALADVPTFEERGDVPSSKPTGTGRRHIWRVSRRRRAHRSSRRGR